MNNVYKSALLSSPKRQLAIILILYITLGSIFGYANRYYINPDGVSYLRLAGYIAEGNFQQSVSGHWGPLISWCLAPFLLIGFDGLNAARLVLAISGLGVLSGIWFLAKRFDFEFDIKFIVLVLSTLLIVSWSENIAPDLLMTAFLICYLYMVTNPNILTDKKTALLCGLFGGLSFLSKHYAFPFFLVHFPLILSLRGYIDRGNFKFINKNYFSILLLGLISFLVISSPLLIAYQVKYDRFTIGTSGLYNYAATGPGVADRHPPFYGLRQPEEYAIHVWEDPHDFEDSKMWSPFENKEYFKRQIKLILVNINKVYKFFNNNYFIVGILSVCFLPFAFFISSADRDKKFLYGWIMITVILYCSGFTVMYLTRYGARYFLLIFLIVLMLSFKFIQEIMNIIRTNQKYNLKVSKNIKVSLLLITMLSFSLSPTIDFILSIKKITHDHQNVYKKIAHALSSVEFPEPYAIIGSKPANDIGLYLAYFADKKFLGRVLSTNLEDITKELKEAGVRSVLVSSKSNVIDKLNDDERYRHIVKINKGELGWDKELNLFIVN